MTPKALRVLPNPGLWEGVFYSLWLQHVFACHACFWYLNGGFCLRVGHAFLPLGYGQKPIPKVFLINGKGNNFRRVGFGRCEPEVHVLQRESNAHENDSDVAYSISDLFDELCACLLSAEPLDPACLCS